MTAWAERSPEVASLLNPAFCGLLIYSAIDGFTGQDRPGMPFEFTFLVVPLVLHGPTRELFPKSVATPFHTWVNTNPLLRIGLADRVRACVPITREATMTLMLRNVVSTQAGVLEKVGYKA